MTDKPKPWPHECADARDRAAEKAVEALNALAPLEEAEMDVEKLRRIARSMAALFVVIRLLESVGAKTRP